MVRIGIVGSGKMGILHGAILGALPDARVVAVCERKGLVRRLARGALADVRVVEDVADLASVDLDAVYVATLPGAHHAVLGEVYRLGVANVFVEKPLAASHDEGLEICRMAERAGGVAMVGFQKRFNLLFAKTKQLLEEEALGEISRFEAWAYASDFVADIGSDSQESATRGGVLRDWGAHAIDLAQWFFGPLEVVQGDGAAPPEDAPPDFISGEVRTEAGASGTFSVSGQMAEYRLPEIGMRIEGSAGRIAVNDDRVELVSDGDSRTWHKQDLADNEVPFVLGESEYTRENVAFVDAVLHGRDHGGADFPAGAAVDRVIDGILAGGR